MSTHPGHHTAAPAAVFVPGLAGQAAEFDALARCWTGGPTLCLDPLSSGDLSIAGQARHVAARAADAGFDRFVVIGHSQGGLVGLELAVSRPDLVAGVACLDSPLLLPRPLRAVLRLFTALLGTRLGPPLLRAFFRATFVEADSPEHRDAVLERLGAVPHPVAHRIIAGAFDYDAAAALDALRVPATCVKADVPSRLDRLPAPVRGCTISTVGHWIHVHRPQDVSRELEVLVAAVTAADPSPPPAEHTRQGRSA